MKFESKQAYVDTFQKRIKLVSERDHAAAELRSDIDLLVTLETKVRKSIENRDGKLLSLNDQISAIKNNRSNYSSNFFNRRLREDASNSVKDLEQQIEHIKLKRGRLFGKELPVEECLRRVVELLSAARQLISDLNYEQFATSRKAERAHQKREEKRAAKEAMLSPYAKKIALGEAAMGKTRAVAAVRKRKLKKSEECPYCGKPFGTDAGVADHIHPVARGGLSVVENMVFICTPCNQKKSDRTLNEYIYRYRLDMVAIHSRLSKLGKRY